MDAVGVALKLIFCPQCEDIFRLIRDEDRVCKCGKSGGRYNDDLRAEIWGNAVPLGFENASFAKALTMRPKKSVLGARFTAFVIPKECDTISIITRDDGA